MKNILQLHKLSFILLACLLALASLFSSPVRAAPQRTIVGGNITADTTWTESGSPYQVNSSVVVDPGVTLTIEAGATVENYSDEGSFRYNFDVQGTLIADGTAAKPIHFNPGPTGWSGINIFGYLGDIHTGSSLSYVIVDSGGYGGSGVAANLIVQHASVDVFNSQFNNSPGDGILGNDEGGQGNINISDSSFSNNQGYAVKYEDGSVNPLLHNLTASGNGASLPYGGEFVFVNDATMHGLHTWENMGLPYIIVQSVVAADSNLIIEPGVQVYALPGNDALDVEGLLLAEGAAGQEIHFDPIEPSTGWGGINILGSEALPGAGGIFDHVVINKGGYLDRGCGVYIEYGNATMTNSQINGSAKSGLCLDHGSTLVMTSTLLADNQAYAIDLIDAGSLYRFADLTATGNLSNTIGVGGGTLYGDRFWPNAGIDTYDVYGFALTVAPTGTLEIERGLTVLFGETRDITVKGTLYAIGAPDEPILFTGETPAPGLWSGLQFVGTAAQHAIGRLSYATLEYGGYGGSGLVGIENADVTFRHCLLRNSAADLIKIFPGLESAGLQGAPLADQPVHVGWSQLLGSGSYAINNQSTQPVMAAWNWWGAASGPAAEGNPGGTGSGVSGPADYANFLSAPQVIFLPMLRK